MTSPCSCNCCGVLPVSTINVNTTTIFLPDEDPAIFKQEEYDATDLNSNILTLAFTPYDSETVKLFLNGVLQMQGVNYTISGAELTFIPPAGFEDTADDAKFIVTYVSGDTE